MNCARTAFTLLALLGFTASGCHMFRFSPRATVGPALNTQGKIEFFATLGFIFATNPPTFPSPEKFHFQTPADFGVSYYPERDRYLSMWKTGMGAGYKIHPRFDIRGALLMNVRGIVIVDGPPRDFLGLGASFAFLPSLGHIPGGKPYYSVHLGTELHVLYYHNYLPQSSQPPAVEFALPLVFEMNYPYYAYFK
jgi:hypothetical protein